MLHQPSVLLLDEPTNNLDLAARERLAGVIASFRGTLVVASHDRELLNTLDGIGDLRGGSITWFGGTYDRYEAALAVEQEAAARAGANESGKTSLLRTITGELPPAAGTVEVRVPLRHLPQRMDLLDPTLTVAENIAQLAPETANNLDLASVAVLVDALRSYRGALIVVSHEELFLEPLDLTRLVQL